MNYFIRALLLMVIIGVHPFGNRSLAQQSTENWPGPKIRIAVMDLSGAALKSQTTYQTGSTSTTIAIPPPAEFALGLTEMLTTALVKTSRFVVVERAAVEKIINEQNLGASGQVNPETAAAKGKIIGAQSLVTGEITEFSYRQSSIGGSINPINILKAKSDRVTAMVALDIRMIDATTGEVLFSRRAKGTASMTGVAAELTQGDRNFSASASANTPLGRASRQAIEEAVAAILAGAKKVPWSGRIVDVRDGQIYINAGTEIGVQPGMEFDVFEQKEALVDPASGKSLGTPDRRIGSISAQVVEDKYSIAKATEGGEFKRNQLLRFKGQAQKP